MGASVLDCLGLYCSCARSLQGFVKGFCAPQSFPAVFRNVYLLDAQFLSVITSHLVRAVTNIFYFFTVAVGTRGFSGTSTKRHSSPARRRRHSRRCKVRRAQSPHEQGCASSVSGQGFSKKEARDLAADCHLPSEKDLINVDKLFLRIVQSRRQRTSQCWKNVQCPSETTQIAPEGKEVYCHFLSCQLQKLSVGVTAKGTLLC